LQPFVATKLFYLLDEEADPVAARELIAADIAVVVDHMKKRVKKRLDSDVPPEVASAVESLNKRRRVQIKRTAK
jgi:hypothetical protein